MSGAVNLNKCKYITQGGIYRMALDKTCPLSASYVRAETRNACQWKVRFIQVSLVSKR